MKSSRKPSAMSHKPLAVAALCLLAATACRQDMHNQPKAIPLRESMFFKDASSARPVVEGTVARGTLQDDAAFFTGEILHPSGGVFVG